MAQRRRLFAVSVAEQLRSPGVARHVRVAAPLADLHTSTAAVLEGGEVAAEVALEAMTDGRVTVTGTVTAGWAGECRRCLRSVEGVVVVEVQEVFEPSPAPDAETYRLQGDHLDLEPMVRDAVLLSLPLAPLCDEACTGPDPDAHPVRVEGEVDDAERPVDPRWAKLSELRFD